MTDQSERAGRHSIVVGYFHRLFVHIWSNAIMQSIAIFSTGSLPAAFHAIRKDTSPSGVGRANILLH
jgi:hypothetical protein